MVSKLVAMMVVGLLAAVQPMGCSLITVEAGEECPVCDTLFTELETTSTGKRIRMVNQQERGEPKSGTALMFYWASSAIFRSCDYLKYHFGEASCDTQMHTSDKTSGERGNRTVVLDFDPSRGRRTARCPCTNVHRVQIVLFSLGKHALPVDSKCAWSHPNGITAMKLCQSPEGYQVEGYQDLWRCMYEAACPIIDDRHQLAILRDPRAMTVSAYFFAVVHDISNFKKLSLEEFIFEALPSMTQWVGIRYILFEGLLANRSTVLYYEEMLADPVGFHYDYLHSVGLQLPFEVVEDMADAADRGDFPFKGIKGIDSHPGGANATRSRSFKDEISEEMLEKMNEVVRVWLPPALLARFGIAP